MEALELSKPRTLPVGHRFSQPLLLTLEDIIAGAAFTGDANPLHNDPQNDHTKRMGGVIASGSHVTGLFTAMIPTEFSKYGPMIGAQMTVKFLRPIYPDTRYEMSWAVRDYEWKSKLGGYLYRLAGTIEDRDDGDDLLIVRADADIVFYGENGESGR